MTQSKKQEERHLRIIRELLKRPENKKCFDCPAKGPVYVNLLNSSFICARCSGLHRNLSHRVKSISASTFTSAEIDALKRGGNAKAAEIWLAKYTTADFPEPAVDDVDDGQKVISKDSFDKGSIVINPPALSHRSSSLSSSSTLSRQSSAADVRVSERSVSSGGEKTQKSTNPYDALYNNNSTIFDVFQSASMQKANDRVVDNGFDVFQSAPTQSLRDTSPPSLDNLFNSFQSAQPPALQRTASDDIFTNFQSASTNPIQRSMSNDIFDTFQSASTTSLQRHASSSSSSSNNNTFSSSQPVQTTSLQRSMSSDLFTSFQQAPESSILGNGSSTNVFNTLQPASNLTHQQPALSAGITNSNTFATRQQPPYQSTQHQDTKYQSTLTGINFTSSSNNMNNTDPFSPFEIFQRQKTEISAGQASNLPSIPQQQTSTNYQTSVNPFTSTPVNGASMQQSSHFSGISSAYGSHNPFPLTSNSVNVNGSLNNLQHAGSKISFDAAFEDLDPLNNNKKGFVGSEVNGGTRNLW
ncbi:8746_t:CDS:2 [Paraglomus brasilianum]|uniref:8746_t:CDS:1 n=1 Tax=Paraglomus brasilianum TaxID=144538 RepID=A0A9N9A9C9_9GLOM|nr:8746_t:CDS:2 [Paraglomus brasilianum]